MEIDNAEHLLAAVFELVDTKCIIVSSCYVNNTEFSATLRTSLVPGAAGSYLAACNSWILRFSEVTKTNWIVFKTYPKLTKFEFRRQLVCQHFQKGKGKNTDAPRSRNLNCQASLNVVVRKNTTHTRKADRLMRQGLNTFFEVSNTIFMQSKNLIKKYW